MTEDEQLVRDALPSYDIHGELGRGGWGVVFGGRHRQLGREVAIKQLPPNFAADPGVVERFAAEARVLASLDHPHIVPIYDYVERQHLCLLVMEQLTGGTLWDRFTTAGFAPPKACALVLATCAGLQSAHQHHILHRDVKPENLMFSAEGTLKVTDFGIAKVVGGSETMATRAGEVVGTPAYIAPEQVRGLELTPATDVYAAATMLYELLSGVLPFDDDGDAMALLFKHAFEPATPLQERAPGVPDAVAEVVMRGVATEASDRYPSAEAFAVALAEGCTESWGPGWLTVESVPVMGAGSILAATERISARPGALAGAGTPALDAADGVTATHESAAAGPVGPGEGTPSIPPGTPPARSTILSGPGVVPPPPPPGPAPRRPTTTPSSVAVKPALESHDRGVDIGSVDAAELVPVKTVVAPPSPTVPLVAALVLLVATVVIALVGLGSAPRAGTLSAGATTVAGHDPVAPGTIRLDLSKPVVVTVSHAAPAADHVRLQLSLLGAGIVTDTTTLTPTPTGATATTSTSTGGQYLVASTSDATLQLLRGGSVVGEQQFPVRAKQPAILTAPGVITIILALIVLAYGESFLRTLRRNRRRASSTVGLVLDGAALGVVVSLAAWLLGTTGLRAPTLIICAVVGALTGAAAAMAAARVGRRRRFKRRSRTAPA